MGKGKFRSGASQSPSNVDVRKAIITAVDKKNWTCTIQYPGGMPVSDVPIEPFVVNSRTGGGSFHMPETGSSVWVCKPSVSNSWFIMGGATLPKQEDEGDDNEDPSNRRYNRPQINEGDQAVSVNDEGFIIMRKGGLLELGASEACKSVYVPLTNILRQFTQNWDHTFGGGRMSMLIRDEDETYGSTRSPVEFQLQIKEFAEDRDEEDQNDYVIDLRMGRIEDEDDESLVGGDLGGCVARFNVNEEFIVWVDRDGNYQCKVAGDSTTESFGQVERIHHASLSEIVEALFDGDYQERVVLVRGEDTETVGGNRSTTIAGNLTEIVKKSVTRDTGPLTETVRGVTRKVQGSVKDSITGALEQKVGDARSIACLGDSSETAGGSKSVTVGNAQNPNPLGKGYQIYVYNGVFAVHDVTGKIVFTSGTPLDETALAHVILKPTGAVIVKPNKLGTVAFEVNSTGAQIRTPVGDITIDNAGTVGMGVGPVRGAVLTTVTQPACLITGIPTIGVSSVRAGGLPELALPPVSIPVTFVPDKTP